MESEADESSLLDNVDGSTARLLGTDSSIVGRRGPRGSGGGASTHSLNEADLQVRKFVSYHISRFLKQNPLSRSNWLSFIAFIIFQAFFTLVKISLLYETFRLFYSFYEASGIQ